MCHCNRRLLYSLHLLQQLWKKLYQAPSSPLSISGISHAARWSLRGLVLHNRDELKSERPFVPRSPRRSLARSVDRPAPSRGGASSVRSSLHPSRLLPRPVGLTNGNRGEESTQKNARAKRVGWPRRGRTSNHAIEENVKCDGTMVQGFFLKKIQTILGNKSDGTRSSP